MTTRAGLRSVLCTCLLTVIPSLASAQAKGDGGYTPGAGFKIISTKQGEVSFRVFSYIRYLNQLGLDSTYTNAFGTTTTLDRRQDVQLNKVNVQFLGWLLDPRFRWFFYVWTNNTAQGQGAQVVVGGNLQYRFSNRVMIGGGIDALPGVRSTEGNFPYWLSIDNRPMADEFFRPSYSMGFWAHGDIIPGLEYRFMIANNLSQLGVDAGQLDDGFNTVTVALSWFPSTGEYGTRAQYGDFEGHDKMATRLGVHFTRSPENRQGQPTTDAFENVQIRLSDGSIIFAPNLFGPGVQIDDATYHMASFDVGVKYKGFALEGEYYWRWVNGFTGLGTATLPFDQLNDHGLQLLGSTMLKPRTVQLYAVWSKIFGEYGDPWEFRAGTNVYPWQLQVVRLNLEYIQSHRSPVGGLSLPYQVGGTGSILYFNVQVDF